MIFMAASVIAVILLSGKEVDTGLMTVGEVTAIVTYITQTLSSMMMISMLFFFFSRGKASADRVREVLNTQPAVRSEKDENVIPETEGSGIEFRNAEFSYPGATGEPVLSGIDLKIEPGEFVAILGSTGAGKTSLVNLIPRFYDVTSGEVLGDGINVKDYGLTELRDKIGIVLQQTTLFSGTIEENIRWGKEDATEEEILCAARTAQADGYISSFPDGYSTRLGQGGLELSGGQKQRLCIARAIIKRPRILIMDDSTSALDMGTEARLRNELRKQMNGMTTVIIAQRISSVMHADRIAVIDKGRLVGYGTHEQLLSENEIYRDIYDSQLGQGGDIDG